MDLITQLELDASSPIIIADEQGMVTFINDHFEQAYGWTQDDLLGQPLLIIIPPALHDAHNLGFSRFVTTGETTLMGQALNLKIVTKSQNILEAIHIIKGKRIKDAWVIGATITLT